MSHYICLTTQVPLRHEPSERSEMLTQMLFGELATVVENRKDWIKVKMAFDSYEGWTPARNLHELDPETYDRFIKSWKHASTDLISWVKEANSGARFPVGLGSSFPRMLRENFKVGRLSFSLDGKLSPATATDARKRFVTLARKFHAAPYLWGGRTPMGIDCSGLVQVAAKAAGLALPRDAFQQAGRGDVLSFLEEAQAGDLAFFDNEEGRITHVGIILDTSNILHASAKVRIDKLDHQGIYCISERRYTHSLRLLKRIF